LSASLRAQPPEKPEPPAGELTLRAPPEIDRHDGASGVWMNAIAMLGGLGSVALVATSSQSASGQARSIVAAGFFLFTTLAFATLQTERQWTKRARIRSATRMQYLRYLGTVRTIVRDAAARQRAALVWLHPDPSSLPSLAHERTRVWENRTADAQFLRVRYGVCRQPLSLELVPPDQGPIRQVDPAAASALHRLLAVHRVQRNLPAAVDLRAFDRIELCGTENAARSLARAVICSAAAFHSPEDLAIAVLASEDLLVQWDWIKWLPHALSAGCSDALGPRRMVSTDLTDLAALLPPDLVERLRVRVGERPRGPHILFVLDGVELPPGNVIFRDGLCGVTVLDLPSRWGELDDPSCLRLLFEDHAGRGDGGLPLSALRLHAAPVLAVADQCDLSTAEALARRLTPLPVVITDAEERPARAGRTTRASDLMDLLGLGDVRSYDSGPAWRQRADRDHLRVPIGLGEGGDPIHLDLKESAQQGMGPHGLVIGATGSGKSELLRTVVLGLALTHSPEQLNMVLVDFKGGATFAGMSAMPHVSALITNLAEELTLVDRMQDALFAEMVRRQELLRDAGNRASLHDYRRARDAGEDLPPLPSLFVVVDEFSEMLSAKPEFLELFVAIGRVGRSLGLHLLLASQRLEEGRLRGLESHLSYRVGLRTFSAQESRAVLGVPDAYELPSVPGVGLLRPDPSTLVRFTGAYVSGPLVGRTLPVVADDTGAVRGVLPWTIAEVRLPEQREPLRDVGAEREPAPGPTRAQETLLDVAVSRMQGTGPAAHQVWLPPLDVPDTLDELMSDLVEDPRLGLVSRQWRALGGLTVPLGTVDRPREQRREALVVDLSGAGGHVAVVGGPRTGKSTLLRTLVAALSLSTTPRESQFFLLDFSGGTLAGLASMPHVAGFGTRSEPDVVRRILAEVTGMVDRREAYFRAHAIESIETYRSSRCEGSADDGYGDVFLVVDGWSALRADFDDLELDLHQLASRGLTFGVHVITASSRWSDYRASIRDLFATRLELKLADSMDSEIDRKQAALVPLSRPGRGLVHGGLHFLAALPRVDGEPDAATLGDGMTNLVTRIAQAWRGPPGPKLRLLPERITPADLLRQTREEDLAGRLLLLGVDERELAPVGLDADAEPHWLIFGDGRSGKSAALRAYLHEVMRTRTPEQAQIVVVDHRRSLLGEVPDEYLLDYVTSTARATPILADLAAYLQNRIPDPDVTAAQLRNRSWWSGAEVFVVIDDYDLVATQHSSPAQVLQPLLAQARDVGLHLALARRSGGASRALYEPVIQALRDLAVPGLVLSGSPDEGHLIGGVRPTRAPPGRGRLVTRDRGVEVIQLAWREPGS
jgi:S-DNA-T family DNA segregation ATPase FtsK/SpoIIIE